jgi:prepilin peptidase CpaA
VPVLSHLNNLGPAHYYILGLGLVCAITDLRTGRIYNVITYPSIVFGIVYNILSGEQPMIISSLVGFAVGVLPFGLAASRGWIGAGDAKLFAAIGATGGFFFLMDFLFNTFAIAGIYCLLLLIWHAGRVRLLGQLVPALWLPMRSLPVGNPASLPRRRIRMGAFIFVGVVLSIVRISVLRGM